MKLKFIIDKKYDLRFARNANERKKLELQYQLCKSVLLYTASEYQKAWDGINDEFSEYVENTTGYKWTHKKYYCVVSPVHVGISNWDGSNKIVRWWYENAYSARRITAHELIIHYYFHIVRKYFSEVKLTDKQIWALAEIAAFALTSLTPEVKKFWPWDTSGYYTDHNYPKIIPLQKKFRKPFLERKSFDEYIRTGIRLVEKVVL